MNQAVHIDEQDALFGNTESLRLASIKEAAEAWEKHVTRYARIINGWPAGLTRHSKITAKGAAA
jgi:hypothetical protein